MVLNLPRPIRVWVDSNALYNYRKEHTELIEGWWHSVKCVGGKPFVLEVYFPHNGASYDKLTLEDVFWKSEIPTTRHTLDTLQIWDVFSEDSVIFEKKFFHECSVNVLLKTKEVVHGTYEFTVDWTGYIADVWEEHKSANFVFLENGQIAAQPNNRIRWVLPSLPHDGFMEQKIDWEARQEIRSVEREPKWLLGDREWSYEEKESNE